MGVVDALRRLTRKTEDRRDYTDQILIQEYGRALRGSDADLLTACTNAARVTAWTLARGRLELDGPMAEYWRGVITTAWLFEACFDVLMYGDAVYALDTADTDAGMLDRVGAFTVHGKRRPYRYRVEVMHPDAQNARTLRESEILHLMHRSDRSTPWRGVSVFQDVLLKCIESGLLSEAKLPVQRAVNYPRNAGAGMDTMTDKARQQMDDQFYAMLSRPGLLHTTDNSTHRGTAQTVQHTDLAFSPDAQAVELRKDLVRECYQAVAFPAAMMDTDAPGQTVRQEHARWVLGSLQPLADVLADKIGQALEVRAIWDMAPARIPLALDQSAVFADLTGGGIPKDQALRIAGLTEGK